MIRSMYCAVCGKVTKHDVYDEETYSHKHGGSRKTAKLAYKCRECSVTKRE